MKWVLGVGISVACLQACGSSSDNGKEANVGETCTLKDSSLANEPLSVEKSNTSCASGLCLSTGGKQYCTEECKLSEGCATNTVCASAEPYASAYYCMPYRIPTDARPTDPAAGSARYHASEALAYATANWAADAYLTTVRSSDVQPSGLLGAVGAWRFDFEAPSKTTYITLDVSLAGVDSSFTELPADVSLAGANAEDLNANGNWLYDSQDLPTVAGPFGASRFLADHPNATAQLQLASGVLLGEPVLIWQYNLYDLTSGAAVWSGSFDAKTGDKIF